MRPFQETRRLFGPSNRPHYKVNVRHCAFLRKSIELYSVAELEATFGTTTDLQMVMGSVFTSAQFGKIKTNRMRNGLLVCRETDTPDADAQRALRAYADAYDAYFKKQGNAYAVRDASAHSALQRAEQTWHDWIVVYRTARGWPGRPDWALQPLPGFQRVQVTAARAATRAPAPVRTPTTPTPAQARTRAPTRTPAHLLPTPPPSSPPRGKTGRVPRSSPGPFEPGSLLCPIAVSDDEEHPRPSRKRKFLGSLDISDDENDQGKHDIIEISDDDEADTRPRKKMRFLGAVDLTI
ncbi:hypothetical protein C8R43DRAFT_1128089 [Mycena crocata]|nr:hypothetical protein C8R43DRAFT_1128089 [Mycena crocata]